MFILKREDLSYIDSLLKKYKGLEDFEDLKSHVILKSRTYGVKFAEKQLWNYMNKRNSFLEFETSIEEIEEIGVDEIQQINKEIDGNLFWNTLALVGDFNPKENIIINSFRDGKTLKEIADYLQINEQQVKNFMYKKVKSIILKNEKIFREFL